MILLFHPKYLPCFERNGPNDWMRSFMAEARIPENTMMMIIPDLPTEDDEGNPIFAFKVSAGETHYWRGEPIKMLTEKPNE